jgi:hypothetical protein
MQDKVRMESARRSYVRACMGSDGSAVKLMWRRQHRSGPMHRFERQHEITRLVIETSRPMACLFRFTSSSNLQIIPPASDPTGLALRARTPHQRHPSIPTCTQVPHQLVLPSRHIEKTLIEEKFEGFGFARHNPPPPLSRVESASSRFAGCTLTRYGP